MLIRPTHLMIFLDRPTSKPLIINQLQFQHKQLESDFIHMGRDATRSEAEFLVKCLHVILETFEIIDIEKNKWRLFDISREIGVESTPDFSLVKMRTCPAPRPPCRPLRRTARRGCGPVLVFSPD